MPRRANILTTDYYYHVFNRGVAYLPIFQNKRDYQRALDTVNYYRFENPPMRLSYYFNLSVKECARIRNDLLSNHKPLVEILAWVFMQNHWHFLLKQNIDNGITTFMSRLSDSYTKYFNTKYERVGPLFQGPFKSVFIPTEELLVHISRYIHLNPLLAGLVTKKHLLEYPWSSLPDYAKGESQLCEINTVLSRFKSPQDYLEFVLNQEQYARQIKNLKTLLID